MTFGGAQKIVRIAFMLSAGVVALLLASPGVARSNGYGRAPWSSHGPIRKHDCHATVIVTTPPDGAMTPTTNRDGNLRVKNLALREIRPLR